MDEAMHLWWEHVLRYSRRDQLSINYVLDSAGLVPRRVEIDNFESEWHHWPVTPERNAAMRKREADAGLRRPWARALELEREVTRLQDDLSASRRDAEKAARDATRAEALELQVETQAAALQRVAQVNDQLRRARASSDEQARIARLQAAAARQASDDAEDALAAVEQPPAAPPSPPPLTLRRVAGKARRSPRWAARQLRARLPASQQQDVSVETQVEGDPPPSRFERHWYLIRNPDVRDAGIDPWVHYRNHGRFEGRSPHPLFDRAWYTAEYSDAAADGADPFADWAHRAGEASRNPNQFFDVAWYLRKYPEVAEAGLDPVEHYRLHGWREGRKPGPLFDPHWYAGWYLDVKQSDVDPLTHYLNWGRGEGRHANQLEHAAATGRYRPPDGLIPWFSPVNFTLDPGLRDQPRLNVLVPGLGIRHMTGGPNTAIQLRVSTRRTRSARSVHLDRRPTRR